MLCEHFIIISDNSYYVRSQCMRDFECHRARFVNSRSHDSKSVRSFSRKINFFSTYERIFSWIYHFWRDSNHFATNIQSTNESQKEENRDTSTTLEIISIQIHSRRIDFDIVHEICYVDVLREVCNSFSLWRRYQVSWFDDWQVNHHEQMFHMWWIKSYLKKVFECQ